MGGFRHITPGSKLPPISFPITEVTGVLRTLKPSEMGLLEPRATGWGLGSTLAFRTSVRCMSEVSKGFGTFNSAPDNEIKVLNSNVVSAGLGQS